jgi:hypothetical protein
MALLAPGELGDQKAQREAKVANGTGMLGTDVLGVAMAVQGDQAAMAQMADKAATEVVEGRS